jgi:hypothetical protein
VLQRLAFPDALVQRGSHGYGPASVAERRVDYPPCVEIFFKFDMIPRMIIILVICEVTHCSILALGSQRPFKALQIPVGFG